MTFQVAIAQLGERQTEYLKVPGLIPDPGILQKITTGLIFIDPAKISEIK